MPYRKTPLATGEYYHVFNRGVAKLPVFINARDYTRFIQAMRYYAEEGREQRFSTFFQRGEVTIEPKIITFITYCLMPNHFHFLLRQERNGGISEFMRKLGNSYTRYFNVKHNRVGPLFQGQFKAVRIETNEQLIHVNRYIHLNPIIGYVSKSLESYPWSSYNEYVTPQVAQVCEKTIILDQFSTKNDYKQFVFNQEDYARKLNLVKHQLFDAED